LIIHPTERRALLLACLCNGTLFASFYILRPVRDTLATLIGTARLQGLFTGTFIGTLLAAPIYAALLSRLRLARLLPGLFAFWVLNALLFALLLHRHADNIWIAGAYFVWFSVVNLYMVSVFWSLMVDVFSASQATRLFPLIAGAGELGAIAGPLLTHSLVGRFGLAGLLLLAAAGLLAVTALVQLVVRAKRQLGAHAAGAQRSSLEHGLAGHPFEGFRELLSSAYLRRQAWFVLLMSWVNTLAYFFQTDLLAREFPLLESRAQVIADIDLVVNVCSAVILLFGLGRLVQRFGVTAGLILNPLVMIVALIGLWIAPGVRMLQALQVTRRVGQYAIARPSREICFTVVEQSSRYKAKNVVDTVIYRFGDLSSAWLQAGMRTLGLGFSAAIVLGLGASVAWGVVAVLLGRNYEQLRSRQESHGGAP
jgi:AAA family ATP:ADP antiporter